MGPHSLGPQVCGNVRCSRSCLGVMSAAAARSPNASASPAPLSTQTQGVMTGCDTLCCTSPHGRSHGWQKIAHRFVPHS